MICGLLLQRILIASKSKSYLSSSALTRRIELAAFEPRELGLPHVALHDGVEVLEPVELVARHPAPKLVGLKLRIIINWLRNICSFGLGDTFSRISPGKLKILS